MARKKVDPSQKIIDASLKLAEEKGWRPLGLPEIAEAAGVSLSELHRHFVSKQAILDGFSQSIDGALLDELDEDLELEEPARDRLFDVLMRRFDLLQPHRPALARITYDQLNDPLALCGSLRQLSQSMRWMLEGARIGTGGLVGAVRVKALVAIYLSVIPVWLRDETADQSKTMAALDARLRRVEGLIDRLGRGRYPARDGESDEEFVN